MENIERVTGDKILKIFDRLKKERTILKLNILGIGYEGLSIIIDVKGFNKPPYFLIDLPGGAQDNLLNARGKTVAIEFTGNDKVPCSLKSVIESVTEKNISIIFPGVITRLQRRKYFRIPAPLGTKAIIIEKDARYEFNVIDISEGGILISHPDCFHNGDKFFEGAVKPLLIVYNEGANEQRIAISKAQIKRIEKITDIGRVNYAFQFLDRGIKAENDIMNLIYSYQRRLLQRRNSL